jgi:nitrogen fixation/metabolism regulation signal transduction histidine kinase
MFLLTLATNNRALYERNYAWLFGVNVVVALLLFAVLVWVAVRLVHALAARAVWQPPAGQAGGHLCAGGAGPGLLIYVVSYQFVSRSIESWFDVKVEGALTPA